MKGSEIPSTMGKLLFAKPYRRHFSMPQLSHDIVSPIETSTYANMTVFLCVEALFLLLLLFFQPLARSDDFGRAVNVGTDDRNVSDAASEVVRELSPSFRHSR